MQLKLTTLLTTIALFSFAPRAKAICCVEIAGGSCARALEHKPSRIYSSDAFNLEGASNVFTGTELSKRSGAACCCAAASAALCVTEVRCLTTERERILTNLFVSAVETEVLFSEDLGMKRASR